MVLRYPDGREEPLPPHVQEELDEFARSCEQWRRNVKDALVMIALIVIAVWLTGGLR